MEPKSRWPGISQGRLVFVHGEQYSRGEIEEFMSGIIIWWSREKNEAKMQDYATDVGRQGRHPA